MGFGQLGSAFLAAAIALLIVAALPRIAGVGEDDAEKKEQTGERKDQSG